MGREDARRGPLRLPVYDYCQPGGYFVTLCSYERAQVFGTIRDGQVALSEAGQVAARVWRSLPEWFPHVTLDCYVVMPNHVHGVLLLLPKAGMSVVQGGNRAKHGFAPTTDARQAAKGTQAKSLSALIQAYKSSVTRECNRLLGGNRLIWQRGCFDHVIRDEQGLQRIREYVSWNPSQWSLDRENQSRTGLNPFYHWLEEYSGPPPANGTQR
jgi:REP element-mobilizing transposase RayT